MTVPGDNYNITSTFTSAFKQVFINDNKVDIFNFQNDLLKRIKTTDDFVGTDREVIRNTGFMGGYGFGSTMPRLNESPLIRPRITAKKQYVRAGLDTESMAAAMESSGAFFDLVQRVKLDVNRAVEHALSLSLCKTNISNDLDLGVIDTGGVSGSGTVGTPYVLVVTAASWFANNFHVKQILNIGTGDVDPFEVVAINETTRAISVVLLSGDQVPAQDDHIFLQGSEGAAFTGLKAATAASGTLYNVALGGQWLARNTDKNSAVIDEHLLYNELMQVKNKCGATPNLIACGLTQYLMLSEFLADKRTIFMPSKEGIANQNVMGHTGLQIACDSGVVDVIWDRLIENDTIYFLNTEHMELIKRPLSGMATVGGDILMPDYINDLDRYLITFRCYGDFFLEPTYMSVLTDLALATA